MIENFALRNVRQKSTTCARLTMMEESPAQQHYIVIDMIHRALLALNLVIYNRFRMAHGCNVNPSSNPIDQ
jgi:hypothetical protein